MTKFQKTFKATLIDCGWSEERAHKLASSDYVYRCVCQGERAEEAARGMAARYPAKATAA